MMSDFTEMLKNMDFPRQSQARLEELPVWDAKTVFSRLWSIFPPINQFVL